MRTQTTVKLAEKRAEAAYDAWLEAEIDLAGESIKTEGTLLMRQTNRAI